MIIIQLAGGLGNQMFQYALYLQLKALGKDVKIDDRSGFAQDRQRSPALAPFGVSYERASAEELERMLDSSPRLYHRVRRRLLGRNKKAYFEADKRYKPEILAWDDIYLEGYWQTEKYFRAVSDEVRRAYDTDRLLQYVRKKSRSDIVEDERALWKDCGDTAEHERTLKEDFGRLTADHGCFQREDRQDTADYERTLKESSDKMTMEEWLERIASCESVSVHIRRGDYLLPENQALFGNICTDVYYKNAMEQMRRAHPDCQFFLFTNDKQWAGAWTAGEAGLREAGAPAGRRAVHIIDLGEPDDDAEFALMSKCRHNILANSSFSWWASYLNKNPGKTVFAPERWLNGWDCEDFYREDMKRIEGNSRI